MIPSFFLTDFSLITPMNKQFSSGEKNKTKKIRWKKQRKIIEKLTLSVLILLRIKTLRFSFFFHPLEIKTVAEIFLIRKIFEISAGVLSISFLQKTYTVGKFIFFCKNRKKLPQGHIPLYKKNFACEIPSKPRIYIGLTSWCVPLDFRFFDGTHQGFL